MSPHRRNAVLGFAAAALLMGCAGKPTRAKAPASPISECGELQAEIAGVEEAKRSAVARQQAAWKAVIPFAVAARYAGGKSAADDADKRLQQLKHESARQGCNQGREP